ncbi:tryptophan--tRNA ligase [Candidatus Nitrosocosmicus franklandus]|uniref:Tryptophan--tRNA ligase n=1 Tax=Candidatus Nitrosocosmicus franklandianus TaxID=1798806 RepID=A0A484I6H1_9ARCH|nr:tryptophan--tRNA ligase [Candidatus Nitrosocosmicus franklandus]VFJ12778.1 Tryptophan--tRNA ligase [Candidatus Nitrosocosmicus franklandus]
MSAEEANDSVNRREDRISLQDRDGEITSHESPNINSGEEFNVTPWEVAGEVDYTKLIEKFGTSLIDETIVSKIHDLTGEIHPFLKNRFFFSHRDLDWILREYEKGNKFYLYTGRGPSGQVHLGHLMPWLFTKYLQDKFNVKLIFQITDDEKFLYSEHSNYDSICHYTYENILDIIAIGFDPNKTRIIINTRDINYLYKLSTEIAKRITFSTAKAVFGFTNSTNIGMIGFPPIQGAPCFLPSLIEGKSTPVLIPAAIDQDPYWRMTRDIAEKLGYPKPAQIHSKFIPGLVSGGKMSSSKPDTALFTVDDPETLETKVKNTFTGGQPTVALQRKLGGNANICPVYWYLNYLFDSEKESRRRYIDCTSGNLLCGECKDDMIKKVKPFMKEIQTKREEAQDMICKFTVDGKDLNNDNTIQF